MPATFAPDGNQGAEIKGMYTPPGQAGSAGSFNPINSANTPTAEVHGRVTPIAGQGQTNRNTTHTVSVMKYKTIKCYIII